MFFFEMEAWRKYIDELGIQAVVDHLHSLDLPGNWPTTVADPEDKYTFFLLEGKPYNKSACPCYQGYYLDALSGAVQCSGTGELLPGVVWSTMCSKEFVQCPFYRMRRYQNADR